MAVRLDEAARDAALQTLPSWAYDATRGALVRELEFADFASAFGFMTQVALIAERMDHHPDWSNAYKVVRIALRSHDADGVSPRDVTLARAIDRVLGG